MAYAHRTDTVAHRMGVFGEFPGFNPSIFVFDVMIMYSGFAFIIINDEARGKKATDGSAIRLSGKLDHHQSVHHRRSASSFNAFTAQRSE